MADLSEAIFEKDLALLERLLTTGKHQVNAKLRPRDDISLLHLAVIMDFPAGVELLCAKGAKLSTPVFYDGYGFDDYDFISKIHNGDTALGLAKFNGCKDCENVLTEAVSEKMSADIDTVKKKWSLW